MRISLIAFVAATAALVGVSQSAAAPPAPVSTDWSGFYAGLTFGWGWEDTKVTATGNDVASRQILTGTFGLVNEQPAGPVSFNNKGAFAGIEAGYNWQLDRRYVVGIEADFNASGIEGRGAVTTAFSGPTLFQQLSATQNILWFGTVRPRLGWLATDNLLLYGTGGLAYGRVHDTINYGVNALLAFGTGGFAVTCRGNFTPCISGQSYKTAAGWTAGAGGAYRVPGTHASLKIEYLFVDLGSSNTTAVGLITPLGAKQTSFLAAFPGGFSTLRVGLDWNF